LRFGKELLSDDLTLAAPDTIVEAMHGRFGSSSLRLVLLAAVLALIASAATGPTARADSTALARSTSLGPPPLPDALRYRGRGYAAGQSWYRVGDTGTVPVYSLTLGRRPDPEQALEGIEPKASLIRGLAEATYLATCSAQRGVTAIRGAAAYQLAIWHFANAVPLTRTTVPDVEVRASAQRLVRQAAAAVEARDSCMDPNKDPLTEEGFSRASFGPSISLASDQTVSEQVVSVTLDSGNVNKFIEEPQVLEIRIDGVPAFVCTGQETTIDTDQAKLLPVKAPCGKTTGSTQLQYPLGDTLPTFPVDGNGHYKPKKGQVPLHGFASAVVRLPRRGAKQQVRVLWNSHSTPGVVYVGQGAAESVITAGVSYPNVDDGLVITPTTLSGFGSHVESDTLAALSQHGVLGVLVLGLLVLLLITARDWFIPVLVAPFKLGRRAWEAWRA
jgi:hypothetical protein